MDRRHPCHHLRRELERGGAGCGGPSRVGYRHCLRGIARDSPCMPVDAAGRARLQPSTRLVLAVGDGPGRDWLGGAGPALDALEFLRSPTCAREACAAAPWRAAAGGWRRCCDPFRCGVPFAAWAALCARRERPLVSPGRCPRAVTRVRRGATRHARARDARSWPASRRRSSSSRHALRAARRRARGVAVRVPFPADDDRPSGVLRRAHRRLRSPRPRWCSPYRDVGVAASHLRSTRGGRTRTRDVDSVAASSPSAAANVP